MPVFEPLQDFLRAEILPRVMLAAIRLFMVGWRVRKTIHPETQKLMKAGEPMIFAFWHGQLFLLLNLYDPNKLTAFVSPSRDGQAIVKVGMLMGWQSFVRGSPKRGGGLALMKLARKIMDENQSVLVTVDGPMGPRHGVKPGAVKLASVTGAPIIPVHGEPNFLWRNPYSWDRFEIPLPFSSMPMTYGEPFYVPADLDDEGIADYGRQLAELIPKTS